MRTVFGSGETEKLKKYIGEELYRRMRSSSHICLSLEDGALFIKLRYCDVKDASKKDDNICIYCGKSEFVFAGVNERCAEILKHISPESAPLEQLLGFFLALTADDLDVLEKLEDAITSLEDGILTARKPVRSVGARIITIRRNLLRMKRYYEQMGFVTGTLADNEDCVLPPELVKHYASLDRRVRYLFNFVLHLRDYTTQVREAYQAQIDIEQNQIMKIFTVITGIFLPLTLIVGWYGMNFTMPEYAWSLGYLYVIGISVLTCILGYFLFKRKKWF